MNKIDLYHIPLKEQDGTISDLSPFKGKVLLIFNSATHSIFTSKYDQIQRWYQQHQKEGFEALDFPCNQFAMETPESDNEINEFCRKNYNTTFKRYHKIDVKGDHIEPLFDYLIHKKKFKGFYPFDPLSGVLASKCIKEGPGWELSCDIKWNFTMFLIDRSGKVTRRFEPTTPMEQIEREIITALDKSFFIEEENS